MGVRSVLIDENLLWDVLLKKYSAMESMEFVWKLIVSGHIKGYITDIAIDNIWHKICRLKDVKVAFQLVLSLLQVLEYRPVERTVMRKACALNLRYSAAIQVLCGLDWQVDGILTSNPLDFCQSGLEGVSVFTPGWLVVNHLECSFEGERAISARQECETITVDGNSLVVVSHESLCGTSAWRLEQLKVCCGGREPRATVVMQTPAEERVRATATGNGPIDAAYKAVKNFFDQCDVPNHRLVYTATQATTADSEVSVTILLQAGDSLFPGRGSHTDTVRAYVYAYIDAVDYMLQCGLR